MQSQSNRQLLTPIGKMKGEINDEFESFYLAKDKNDQVYMNRNPEYTQNRYDQANGWQAISQKQLDDYKKKLHFIPQKSKGLKPWIFL
ncbi:MAG: hypothetical protein KF803_02590 [Cyclobacteriaceae bacterium]|nr:hypothetical protein [Cyclobacteriaceae bacterium]